MPGRRRRDAVAESLYGSRFYNGLALLRVARGRLLPVDGAAGGNTDQTDKIGSLLIRRRTPENRLLINYTEQFSDVNDIETIDNHRLNLLYDIYPERGFFWRPIFFEYYQDPFQNIDHRATIGFGAGYHLLDKPGVTWNISGGPAYRVIQYDSVQTGDDDEADTPALVVGTFFDRALTSTIDCKTLYNFSIVNRKSGSYTHYAKATFNIELTSTLDFDISLVWDRTRDPQPRSDNDSGEMFTLVLNHPKFFYIRLRAMTITTFHRNQLIYLLYAQR